MIDFRVLGCLSELPLGDRQVIYLLFRDAIEEHTATLREFTSYIESSHKVASHEISRDEMQKVYTASIDYIREMIESLRDSISLGQNWSKSG